MGNTATSQQDKYNRMMQDMMSMRQTNNPTIIKEGYLMKKSLHFNKFRKRWIVLTEDSLSTYKDHQKTKPTEIIPLFSIDSQDRYIRRQYWKRIDSSHKSNKTEFELYRKVAVPGTDHEVYRTERRSFRAESIDDMREWIKCIQIAATAQSNKNDTQQDNDKYKHKIKEVEITCEFMKNSDTNDPLICPIYHAMKQDYKWTQQNLDHMNKYTHFSNEASQKPECRYGDECKTYIRLDQGTDKLTDECHMKLYRHPPRTRVVKLTENIHRFVVNRYGWNSALGKIDYCCNLGLYNPTDKDRKKCNYNGYDGYLWALIDEVKSNGYKYDLCLECGVYDNCQHKECSLLDIVNNKMKHIRHKKVKSPLNRGEMLSLILYTGMCYVLCTCFLCIIT